MGIVFIKRRRSREERARKVVQGIRQRIVLGADEERPSGADFWGVLPVPDRPAAPNVPHPARQLLTNTY
jgi:hypothetical protein